MSKYENIKPYAEMVHNAAQHGGPKKWLDEMTEEAEQMGMLKEGSDVKYGARPLRRALRKLVEDPVSDLCLEGKFKEGDTIVATVKKGTMNFKRVAPVEIKIEVPAPKQKKVRVKNAKK